MTTSVQPVTGYLPGTWTIDPAHSEVGFSVRHMMVSKVRGRFTGVDGTIVTAADPLSSTATATIDLSTIDTGNEQRDGHLRSSDFFSVEEHPQMTWRSTGIHQQGDRYVIDGELTLRGVTKPVALTVEISGFAPDAYGGTRCGFSATGEIDRNDFGVSWNTAIEAGGVVVGDKVTLQLEVEAVLAS